MDKWIPVTERPPKEHIEEYTFQGELVRGCISDQVLVTVTDGKEYATTVSLRINGKWDVMYGVRNDAKIIAWMPLPAPYKGDKYTTADNIRSMTDEQLAEFLKSYPGFNHLSYKEVLNWLKIEDGGGC